jgi:hypothetical protein
MSAPIQRAAAGCIARSMGVVSGAGAAGVPRRRFTRA